MCPSGQRRQPKYDHFSALHESLTQIAPILLSSDTALFKNETVKIKSEDGEWVDGPDQRMFRYHNTNADFGITEVVFVENTANVSRIVKVPKRESKHTNIVEMQAYSAIPLVDNRLIFDSSGIKPRFQSFRRLIVDSAATLLDLTSWEEPLGASDSDPRTHNS
jgi:hypothetical protein